MWVLKLYPIPIFASETSGHRHGVGLALQWTHVDGQIALAQGERRQVKCQASPGNLACVLTLLMHLGRAPHSRRLVASASKHHQPVRDTVKYQSCIAGNHHDILATHALPHLWGMGRWASPTFRNMFLTFDLEPALAIM